MIAIALRFLAANWIRAALITGVATLLIAGAVYIKHTIEENGRLEAHMDRLIEINQANTQASLAAQEHARRTILALTAERRAYELRVARLAPIRRKIANASDAEDGPVAPVLRDALDGLRTNQAGDPGGDGEADRPGQPVELPSAATSPFN
ncbi:MAG: hypothetical protein RIA64_01600 [Rhodospirillales bacterium]